ncbi:glycosyltransferase involved in cell wall biosynthesis [Rhodoglobus vestalii]|uniref:D-inositol 3-phosphate glycosyltransferase n=1 Tax=Rhodoglobus vestalii TaxID=193384 RepID=A0A8H2K796_9MICO|nr:glycosyltransferase [Rhodoglobus vestalii]TQO21148.1 glycosyltransferase involved in cell wall biosynthesis [Rhodoglobus vestalii]
MTSAVRRSPQEGKPRLRILIGADTFWPQINGAATFIARLAAGLAERGHDVHIVAPSYSNEKLGQMVEEHEGQKMTLHRVYSWKWPGHPWLRFMLPWRVMHNSRIILDRVKPDVIHFQSHIVIGRGMTLEGSKRGIRLVGTNHFMPENLLDHAFIIPRFLRKKAVRMGWAAAGRSFGRAGRVTTPTRRAADYLEENTLVRDVISVSCGINADGYNGNLEPKPENLIVFLGRLSDEKQIDRLIRAVAILDPALDAKLEIVGGGELEGKLRALVTSLGLDDRVTLTGFVDQDQLRDALQRGSVFAMPSVAELQSISTMEAMASGLPVVAANAMALPHLVHDGENGFLFEPGNVEDLAEKLTRVLTMSADEVLAFKKESLAIVAAHDIQRTLDTFESLYRGDEVTDPAALGKNTEGASF